MTVDPSTSLLTVRRELRDCEKDASRYGWKISDVNEKDQIFTVEIVSPVDKEKYIVEMKFDNYKEWPLHIEFIDPKTGERGTKNAYPNNAPNDGFFHTHPCICNPCNRKSYKDYSSIHSDWSDLACWQQLPQTNTLKNIRSILCAIYSRIKNRDIYTGRMK